MFRPGAEMFGLIVKVYSFIENLEKVIFKFKFLNI